MDKRNAKYMITFISGFDLHIIESWKPNVLRYKIRHFFHIELFN